MNRDDDSDLTDLESSEEEEEEYTSSQQKKGKKKATTTYNLRNPLKVPRATTYAAQALFDQMHNQDIDLDAEYQRDVVWPDAKQISLIDSIFRNFYVPPVIFATKQHDDGSETKICIDGKQRLTSIRRFMDGQIPLQLESHSDVTGAVTDKDALTAEKWWFKESPPGQKTRKVLPEKLRKTFANKQIVCVEYQDISEDDEREVFQRVQLGMALTPAEKLQVTNTHRSTFVRSLVNKHIKDGGLSSDHLEWDTSRGSDFRCLAQALYLLERWGPTLKTIGTILQLDKWLAATTPLDPGFKADMEDTFDIFSELTQNGAYNKCFKDPGKVSPIEFIGISVLIGTLRKKLTMKQLGSTIAALRSGLREVHVDVRMNTRVSRTVLELIRGMKPSQFAQDSGPVAAKRKVGGAKRKRVVESDDEEDEDEMEVDEGEEEDSEGEDEAEYRERPSSSRRRGGGRHKQIAVTARRKKPAPAPFKVKEERQASPLMPPPPALPTGNRLTNLRAAMDSTASNSSSSSSSARARLPPPQISTGTSRISSQPTTPQLPSPGQNFTFPTAAGMFTGNTAMPHSMQQAQIQPGARTGQWSRGSAMYQPVSIEEQYTTCWDFFPFESACPGVPATVTDCPACYKASHGFGPLTLCLFWGVGTHGPYGMYVDGSHLGTAKTVASLTTERETQAK
ncbi:hypothetical protein BKA70DRAFT_1412795 [Coprinopsis sp. MPI-PUGE-AT-0042]|nr:hypothetical protein BKA70DRAFT_1412795 [Coprinopsis sp. MPI-PUGE-AT-0042]